MQQSASSDSVELILPRFKVNGVEAAAIAFQNAIELNPFSFSTRKDLGAFIGRHAGTSPSNAVIVVFFMWPVSLQLFEL